MKKLFIVQKSETGLRLDAVLATRFPDRSRAEWKRSIDAGIIQVNGHPVPKNLVLREGLEVTQTAPETPANLIPNPRITIGILYEDANIIIVNKPSGSPSHPLDLSETETALNAIIARAPSVATSGPIAREGGLVHRLDNDTSGVLVASKNPEIYALLREIFAGQGAKKQYLAIVVGELTTPQTIRFPVAHHSKDDRKMVAVGSSSRDAREKRFRGEPRDAETLVEPINVVAGHSMVRLTICQGQRHQIRVHLAAIGHPICHDPLYQDSKTQKADNLSINRHALHAEKVTFLHPKTKQTLTVSAPIPDDFIRAMALLRK
jgi:23S rRNA pseudouridine1911/1915/1917 synthase